MHLSIVRFEPSFYSSYVYDSFHALNSLILIVF